MFFFCILFGNVYEVIYKAVILIVANIDFYIYIWFTQEEMFQSLSWTPIFARNLLPSLNQKHTFSQLEPPSVGSAHSKAALWPLDSKLQLSQQLHVANSRDLTWFVNEFSFSKTSHVPRAAGHWHEISKHPKLRAVLLMIQTPAALGIHERSS